MLLAAGLFVTYRLFPILLPILELVVIAMLLALVLRVVVNRLERLGGPRWLGVVALVAALGAFGAVIGLLVIPNLAREISRC